MRNGFDELNHSQCDIFNLFCQCFLEGLEPDSEFTEKLRIDKSTLDGVRGVGESRFPLEDKSGPFEGECPGHPLEQSYLAVYVVGGSSKEIESSESELMGVERTGSYELVSGERAKHLESEREEAMFEKQEEYLEEAFIELDEVVTQTDQLKHSLLQSGWHSLKINESSEEGLLNVDSVIKSQLKQRSHISVKGVIILS